MYVSIYPRRSVSIPSSSTPAGFQPMHSERELMAPRRNPEYRLASYWDFESSYEMLSLYVDVRCVIARGSSVSNPHTERRPSRTSRLRLRHPAHDVRGRRLGLVHKQQLRSPSRAFCTYSDSSIDAWDEVGESKWLRLVLFHFPFLEKFNLGFD